MDRALLERRPVITIGLLAVTTLGVWAVAVNATSPSELRTVSETLAPGFVCAVAVLVLGAVLERSRRLTSPLGGPTPSRTGAPAPTDHAAWRISRTGGSPTDVLAATIGGRQRALAERQCDVLERVQIAVAEGRDPGGDLDLLRQLVYRGHRAGQTLLVLAADEPSATRIGPALLDDVILDALADHDDAERVDTTSIDWCVLRADVADDLAHLIAELLDNALEASPTSTAVTVVGRWTNDDYALSITDEGIGLTRAARHDANTVLAGDGTFEAGHGRSFGLSTVARLARRHGIRVRILESPTDGLLAKITLPVSILVDTEPARIDPTGPVSTPEPPEVLDLDDDGFACHDDAHPAIRDLDFLDDGTRHGPADGADSWRLHPSASRDHPSIGVGSAEHHLGREHHAQVVPIANATRRTRV